MGLFDRFGKKNKAASEEPVLMPHPYGATGTLILLEPGSFQ